MSVPLAYVDGKSDVKAAGWRPHPAKVGGTHGGWRRHGGRERHGGGRERKGGRAAERGE